ncbi:hypothetical protein F511_11932 [Dorcoceras hygrometricum]|uniref:Uncharacterized protein n=1 Tax=Dorcoceras hygrometricum TaxID=472368 RepID=A0A2Z7D680_9LAMI|nr:hypothetical protein F511_11932 [Dorcoceras hygrometricum]
MSTLLVDQLVKSAYVSRSLTLNRSHDPAFSNSNSFHQNAAFTLIFATKHATLSALALYYQHSRLITHEMWELPTPLIVANRSLQGDENDGSYPLGLQISILVRTDQDNKAWLTRSELNMNNAFLSYNYNKSSPEKPDLKPAKSNNNANSGTQSSKLRTGSYELHQLCPTLQAQHTALNEAQVKAEIPGPIRSTLNHEPGLRTRPVHVSLQRANPYLVSSKTMSLRYPLTNFTSVPRITHDYQISPPNLNAIIQH